MMILKPGKEYRDEFGNRHSSYIARVVKLIDERKGPRMVIEVEVYSSREALEEELTPQVKVYYLDAEQRERYFLQQYRQERVGITGDTFHPYRFAYMYLQSEEIDWRDWMSDEDPIN